MSCSYLSEHKKIPTDRKNDIFLLTVKFEPCLQYSNSATSAMYGIIIVSVLCSVWCYIFTISIKTKFVY